MVNKVVYTYYFLYSSPAQSCCDV